MQKCNSRQSRIEHRHTRLQQPQQQGIQRPTHDLCLGASHSQPILFRVRTECQTLFIGHGIIGQSFPFGSNAVGRPGFQAIYYPGQQHEIIIQLKVSHANHGHPSCSPNGYDHNGQAQERECLDTKVIGHGRTPTQLEAGWQAGRLAGTHDRETTGNLKKRTDKTVNRDVRLRSSYRCLYTNERPDPPERDEFQLGNDTYIDGINWVIFFKAREYFCSTQSVHQVSAKSRFCFCMEPPVRCSGLLLVAYGLQGKPSMGYGIQDWIRALKPMLLSVLFFFFFFSATHMGLCQPVQNTGYQSPTIR